MLVCGRDRGPRLPGRTKARGFEGERRKDFAGAESIERFAAENLDDFPEQDEAKVGVFGARAGFRFEGQLQSGAQQGGRRRMLAEQGRVSGQARSVRKQHAQRDVLLAAARLHADDEARQDVPEALVEVEQAAIDEEHGGGCGGNHFGEAGEIENRLRLDGRGAAFVGEASNGIEGRG